MTQPDVSALARKYALDVNTGTVSVPVWTRVGGMMEFKDTLDPNLEDDSVYEDEGWGGQTKTALAWTIEGKVVRRHAPDDPTTYDAGQEALRARAVLFGGDGSANVRWYDRFGGPEAYEGFCEVTWQRDGGPHTALDTVAFTLTGKGIREDVDNPAAAS